MRPSIHCRPHVRQPRNLTTIRAISLTRRGYSQKSIQDACKWLRSMLSTFLVSPNFPCGPYILSYCGLAIGDNRYASNETKLFACECYVVFTIPCAVVLLLLFCALSDLRAQTEDIRPLRTTGTTHGDAAITFSTRSFKNLLRIENALGAFDDVCNSTSF